MSDERPVADMLQQLKRERDNFEMEKADSREIVKMLESRLKQMTTVGRALMMTV